jgi:hypothetical protein
MNIIKKSKEHLGYAEEGYTEHLCFAFSHGVLLVYAGLALIAHSIIPAIHTRTASRTVRILHWRFAKRNRKQPYAKLHHHDWHI